MAVEHDKMFVISIWLHVSASIRILLYLTFICLFVLYSLTHNGMCTFKKKKILQNLLRVVQLSVTGKQRQYETSTCMSSSEAYRTILLELVPQMETFLIVSGTTMKVSKFPGLLECYVASLRQWLQKISKEFPPPQHPPSIFQDLMPMKSEPLKMKVR